MEDFFLKLASSNGIWAALSIALIFFILRAQEKRDTKQDEREQNYQKIIEGLTQKYNIIDDIHSNVVEIKGIVANSKNEKENN